MAYYDDIPRPYTTYSHDPLNYMAPLTHHKSLMGAYKECCADPTIEHISNNNGITTWTRVRHGDNRNFDQKVRGINPAYDASYGSLAAEDAFWYTLADAASADASREGIPTRIYSDAEFAVLALTF